MDVIAAHQFGHANVVAAMGTALTEAQVSLIKRFSKRIVLALDADAAGQMADAAHHRINPYRSRSDRGVRARSANRVSHRAPDRY